LLQAIILIHIYIIGLMRWYAEVAPLMWLGWREEEEETVDDGRWCLDQWKWNG
jgi:hypothetical protein